MIKHVDDMEEQLENISTGNVSIPNIESAMLKCEQVDCPVIHRFSPGLYIREVRIPANSWALGHAQKKEHLNLFLQGRLTMYSEDGTTMEMSAPMMFTGKPGRKFGFIHEDVVWLNVYPTDETDIETLEDIFLSKSDSWVSNLICRSESRESEREDFDKLVSEIGITKECIREQSENIIDQIEMPAGAYKFEVRDSEIEGKGVFASAEISSNEVIGPARLYGNRTPLGRYTNHSNCPNAKMVMYNNDIWLVSICTIDGRKGGVPSTEITTNYRETLKLAGG